MEFHYQSFHFQPPLQMLPLQMTLALALQTIYLRIITSVTVRRKATETLFTHEHQRLPTPNQDKVLHGISQANYGVCLYHMGPIYSEDHQKIGDAPEKSGTYS